MLRRLENRLLYLYNSKRVKKYLSFVLLASFIFGMPFVIEKTIWWFFENYLSLLNILEKAAIGLRSPLAELFGFTFFACCISPIMFICAYHLLFINYLNSKNLKDRKTRKLNAYKLNWISALQMATIAYFRLSNPLYAVGCALGSLWLYLLKETESLLPRMLSMSLSVLVIFAGNMNSFLWVLGACYMQSWVLGFDLLLYSIPFVNKSLDVVLSRITNWRIKFTANSIHNSASATRVAQNGLLIGATARVAAHHPELAARGILRDRELARELVLRERPLMFLFIVHAHQLLTDIFVLADLVARGPRIDITGSNEVNAISTYVNFNAAFTERLNNTLSIRSGLINVESLRRAVLSLEEYIIEHRRRLRLRLTVSETVAANINSINAPPAA